MLFHLPTSGNLAYRPIHPAVVGRRHNIRYTVRSYFAGYLTGHTGTREQPKQQRFSVSYITGFVMPSDRVIIPGGWRHADDESMQRELFVPQRAAHFVDAVCDPTSDKERLMPNLGVLHSGPMDDQPLNIEPWWSVRLLARIRAVTAMRPTAVCPRVILRDVDNVPKWTDLSPRLGATYDFVRQWQAAPQRYFSAVTSRSTAKCRHGE